jgi:hypothetical protein
VIIACLPYTDAVSVPWAFLKRVAAGAIFGVYMTHLLYFLNPQVGVSPGRLAIVTILYGIICGLLFGTILWVLRVIRMRVTGSPEPQRAHGFGLVVLAVFVSSAIYWIHWDTMRIYLPIAAFRVLSKATNLITITAFALLILWIIERNAGRRVSRTIFIAGVVLIALSSFSLYQRRESYRTERRDIVIANIGTVAEKRPVIFVAIRDLPHDWIITMNGEGILPFFSEAATSSYFNRLEPFPTTHWRSLWASLATGKLPNRHGVTGRFSYRTPLNRAERDERFLIIPSGVGFRAWGLIPPVERITTQLPSGDAMPVWTLYKRLGLDANVISWPGTATTIAQAVRLRPDAAQRFEGTGGARMAILDALAADVAALVRLESMNPQLRVAALEGLSRASRSLGVTSNNLPDRTSLEGAAIRAYMSELDGHIAELARRNPDHLVVVCSPSAFAAPELAASAYAIAARLINPPDPGADDGFVLLQGPGTVSRSNPATAYVVDVVPTLLFAAGLPVGRDMDGRVLTEAFGEEFLRVTTLSAIQTYEAKQVVVRRRGA